MCISNNRRPYPTNGFKNSSGGVIVPPTLSGSVSLKDAIARSSQSTVPLKATNQKNSSGAADHIGSKNHHIVVQHKHYVDHSNDNRSDYKEDLPARGGVTVPFPIRLHEMLDAVERDGYGHIISWAPHGRCVIIHKPKEFVEILPTYFKLSKLASFQRQLNLYGFQRRKYTFLSPPAEVVDDPSYEPHRNLHMSIFLLASSSFTILWHSHSWTRPWRILQRTLLAWTCLPGTCHPKAKGQGNRCPCPVQP